MSLVAELLRELIDLRALPHGDVFRLLIASKPPSATRAQVRRLMAQLAADPPGFTGTTVSVVDDVYWVVSKLQDVAAVDVGFLTDYRHCALFGIVSPSSVADFRGAYPSVIPDLGGDGLFALLDVETSGAVIRALDMDAYAVMQVVTGVLKPLTPGKQLLQVLGPPGSCEGAIRFFEARQIRRIHDVDRIHEEVLRLSA